MQLKKERLYFFVSFLIISCLLSSCSPIEQFTAGQVVKDVINKLESSANSIIEKAGQEARNSVMVAAQHMLLVIQNLKTAYSDMMNETFDRLKKEQKDLFTNVENTIIQLNLAIEQKLDTFETITNNLNSIISRIPFAKQDPRIHSYTPVYFVNAPSEEGIRVKIKGSLIAHGRPFLRIGASSIPPVEKTDYDQTYIIDNPKGDFPKVLRAILVVYKHKDGFLGLSPKDLPREYGLVFYALPQCIGRISVKSHIKKTTRETKDAWAPPTAGNIWMEVYSQDEFKGDNKSWVWNVEPGWAIEANSIRWILQHNDNGKFVGIDSISPYGFRVNLSADGKGLFNGRGHISGHVVYRIYRDIESEEWVDVPLEVPSLFWRKDMVIQLPHRTAGFDFSIDTFQGEHIVCSKSTRGRLFNLEYDDAIKQIIIRPNEPNEALK